VCEECSATAGTTVRRAYWEHSVLERDTLSPNLVINLKRFTVRASQGGANVKINDGLSFPLTLDLAPYTRSAAQGVWTAASSPPTSPAAKASSDGAQEEPLLYHLRGVIVHKGEASHGHYYCFMHKHGKGWFRIDDETVTPFDLETGLVDPKTSSSSATSAPATIGPAAPGSGGGVGKGAGGSEGLSALADECFGGVDSKNKARAGKKTRNNNAFVLFYQRAPDRHFRGSGSACHDDTDLPFSSSSSDAPRSPVPNTSSSQAHATVKDLETALQMLPDSRHYGTHPDLEEVLDTNLQNMCREILFDVAFSGQVLDFIQVQLRLNAVSADDLLCMGITLLVRVVLRSAEPPRLDEWTHMLTAANALPSRPSACEWLLARVIAPYALPDDSSSHDKMSLDLECAREGGADTAAADAANVGCDWRGKRWVDAILMDCPSEAARKAFCDILLCAAHTWCAAAREEELTENSPVGRVVQALVHLLPAQASNPCNLQTYLTLWAGLARHPCSSLPLAAAASGTDAVATGTSTDGGAGVGGASGGAQREGGVVRVQEARVARTEGPSRCAALLAKMRVPYLLAHLYLASASPDASMPRLAAVAGTVPEPDADVLLSTLNLMVQASPVQDKVIICMNMNVYMFYNIYTYICIYIYS